MIARLTLARLASAALALGICAVTSPLHAQPGFGDNTSRWANDGECDDPRFEGEGAADTLLEADNGHDANDCRKLFGAGKITLRAAADDDARVSRGRLQKGDGTLESGEYADEYTFAGTTGQRAVIDLRSGDFDPYVFVRAPSGEQFDNDDFEGDASRSLLALDLAEGGEYRVTVTSYDAGETGGYTLSIDVGQDGLTSRLDRRGTLDPGDETLTSGEYVDTYEFEGTPGQRVAIDLRSSAFDTYLILKDPAGEQTENDDADGDDDVGHSYVEADLTEAGTYEVLVTSYETGERGSYELTIDPGASAPAAPSDRDALTLTVGSPRNGALDAGDLTFADGGEYHDLYVFDGAEGDAIRLELSSDDFDTYLGVITPSGEEISNDDFAGSTDRSVIDLTLAETGRYRVQATSYGAAETGRYQLALAAGTLDVPVERRAEGRIYGLFAGISDYQPPARPLLYTAEDATRIRDALINGSGMNAADAYTFVDEQATVGNITAAIRAIAARMRPDDTFVMFYSGHGGQTQRSAGPEPADPDSLDETLALYDGELSDDQLRALFDEIDDGTVLLWLDSCHSGGFAKDIVSAPNRMGIFSSEEDLSSNVADKFRAGGYLSYFLDEAIAQGLADEDGDRAITAIELSQYLHERYRADVKSTRAVDVVRTEMNLGYQHLVVDRGSIGAYDVLFQR